jgi:HD domain
MESWPGLQAKTPADEFRLDLGTTTEPRCTPDAGRPPRSGQQCRPMGRDAEQDVFRRHATPVHVPPQLPSLGRMNTLASWAEQLARALLQEPLPRRCAHSQGVATRARGLAVLGADADLLEAAAWLHDIGYAPDLTRTGLHQLDGARYLRDAQHADALLCRLVAYHSSAIVEAGERGLADVLSREFEPAPDALSSVLTFCDMTHQPGRRGRAGRTAAR